MSTVKQLQDETPQEQQENIKEDNALRKLRETIEAKEAAAILGVSEWTVYDLARRRIIPHVRVGRRVLFRKSGILTWLEQQEAASIMTKQIQEGKIRRLE